MLTELKIYKSPHFAYRDNDIFGGRLASQASKQVTHKISCHTRDYIEFEVNTDEDIGIIWDQVEMDV